jgi:hypothetical protein
MTSALLSEVSLFDTSGLEEFGVGFNFWDQGGAKYINMARMIGKPNRAIVESSQKSTSKQ